MRIFDKTMTVELFDCDETMGRFDEGEIITIVPEHFDDEGNIVYEHEESERVKIYYPYTIDQLKQYGLYKYSDKELEEINKAQMLEELHHKLAILDNKALEFIDGYISEEEYRPILEERNELRNKIKEMEN